MSDEPLVLGIETSCDETGVGIVRGETLLVDAIASSVDEHARFGGVVPEVASRAHLEAMVPTIERACATAGVTLRDVDAVAVTSGPGLAGALMVGVASAKALSLSLGVPLYGVNHLASHVAVDIVEHGPLPEPTLALLVSGGHSSLLLVPDVTHDVRSLGSTIDDAAGEAFDKVARVLGLPFPGGPHIDRMAREGSITIDFPRGLTTGRDMERHRFDFSFSGLKTAVSRWVQAREASGEPVPVADVAASFQEAVTDVLTRKAVLACREHGVGHLQIGGGVAANSRLRAMAQERCDAAGIQLRVPRPGLCTDNGAMVAALGAQMVLKGRAPSDLVAPGRLLDAGHRGPGLTRVGQPLVVEQGSRPIRSLRVTTRCTDASTLAANAPSWAAFAFTAAIIAGATEASPVSTMSPPASTTLTARCAAGVERTALALTSSVTTTPS